MGARKRKETLSRERVYNGFGYDIVKTKKVGREPYYTVFQENTLNSALFITKSLLDAKWWCMKENKRNERVIGDGKNN